MSSNHSILFLGVISLLTMSCDKSSFYDSPYDMEDIQDISLFMKKENSQSQGMAISGGLLFVAHDGGMCDVYDFDSQHYISSFPFASSSPDNHCNCIEFGDQHFSDGSWPLLYISNGKVSSPGEWKCKVERINRHGSSFKSELVQTITLDVHNFEELGFLKPWGCPLWLVDKENHYLWVWSANLRTLESTTVSFSDNTYHATKFRIPDLSEGPNILFDASDIVEQVSFEFDAYVTQGGCVVDGVIYYSFGFGTFSSPSKIRAYDTANGCIIWKKDLWGILNMELEDLSFYNNRLYINTNSPYIFESVIPVG